MHEYLLVSDLDGTLLGDESALADAAAWVARNRRHVRLVYATGRFFEPVVQLVNDTALPEPDAVIGGVGTEIRRFPSGEVVQDWHDRINVNWDADRVTRGLSSIPGVEMQPAEFQSAFKVSGYLHDAKAAQLQAIREQLTSTSCEVDMIYSSRRDLDIVPAGANKGTAASFLASTWWSIPQDRVLVSGDSGNDRDLFEHGFLGIVVGNAHRELKELDGARIYHASRPYAGGVLEGWRHWVDHRATAPACGKSM